MSSGRPQYINLFRKDISWRTKVLKTHGVLSALGSLLVGLFLLTLFNRWYLSRAEGEASTVTREYEGRVASLASAGATYRTRDDYRRLQQRVKELTQLLARQDVVLGRMQDSALGTQEKFSRRLAALARAQVDGLWLTQLEINTAPTRIRLAGVAMSVDLLPQYLLQLRGEPDLGIRRLTNLTVDRTVPDERAALAGAIGFSLLQVEPDGADAL